MATTGCMPPMASPAALVTACCSAIPTSKTRSGQAAANLSRPVGCSMAAVMATTSGRAAEVAGAGQRVLDCLLVVAVDRAKVLQAQVLEEHLRLEDVLEPLLQAVQ